jgi:hypothetical protein
VARISEDARTKQSKNIALPRATALTAITVITKPSTYRNDGLMNLQWKFSSGSKYSIVRVKDGHVLLLLLLLVGDV